MNDIDQLLNNINKDENLNNESTISESEKKRILDMTMKKINDESKRKSRKVNFSKRKICLIIIACILVFSAVGVSAAVIFNWNEKLSNYLKVDTVQKEKLSTTGMEINKSVTNNNLTITAVQSVGDKYGLYLLLDIVAPENITLSKDYNFSRLNIKIDGLIAYGYKYSIIDAKENTATLLINVNTSEDLNNRELSITMNDLGYYNDSNKQDKFNSIIEGTWDISWKLNYKDVSKDYEVNRDMKIYGGEAIFKSINVSQFSATIVLIEKTKFDIHSHDSPWDKNQGIIVKLKNGEIIDMNNCGNIFDDTTVITMSFGRVIDVNEIESISFDGEEVKL